MRIHRASLNLQVTCQEEIEQINLVVVDKLSRQLKKSCLGGGEKALRFKDENTREIQLKG